MKSLKEQNRLALSAILGLNLAAIALLVSAESIEQLPALDKSTLFKGAATLLAFPVTRLVVGLAKRELKEFLVYWGQQQPMFRMVEVGYEDQSVDMDQLTLINGGPLPVAPEEQHKLYMRWYRTVADHLAVLDAYGDYLLFRDWIATVCLLCILFSSLIFIVQGWQLGLIFLAIVIAQVGPATVAARNASERLVRNVLSVVSTTPGTSASSIAAPQKP